MLEVTPSKTVLVVENGPQEAKEPLMQRIQRSGFKTLFLMNCGPEGDKNPWYKNYYSDAENQVIRANLGNTKEALKEVQAFLERHLVKLDGVSTYLEEVVPITNIIACALNLPRISNGEIKAVRDKTLMRDVLRRAGVPQPHIIRCASLDDFKRAVGEIGMPCVIKPVEMGSSLGIVKIFKANQNLENIYENAVGVEFGRELLREQYHLSRDVLVEQYVEAVREVSVEGIVSRGEPHIAAITHKHLTPEPDFFEIGHTTPLRQDQLGAKTIVEIERILRKAVDALGLENTAFHAEFRIPGPNDTVVDGKPFLVEIGARLGGDLIPILVEEATGINLMQAALEVSVDRYHAVDYEAIRAKNSKCAGVMFIEGHDNILLLKDMRAELEQNPQIREVKIYPAEDYAHLIMLGENFDEVEALRTRLKVALDSSSKAPLVKLHWSELTDYHI